VNLSGRAWLLLLLILIISSGPYQSLLMKTKLDAPLQQRMTALQEKESLEKLGILGKCFSPIDGRVREGFVEAGAQVHTMPHDLFGSTIPSGRILDVAALDNRSASAFPDVKASLPMT
jgi:hypothetical protein